MLHRLRLGAIQADHYIPQLPILEAGLLRLPTEGPELRNIQEGKRKNIRGLIFTPPLSIYFLDFFVARQQNRELSLF